MKKAMVQKAVVAYLLVVILVLALSVLTDPNAAEVARKRAQEAKSMIDETLARWGEAWNTLFGG